MIYVIKHAHVSVMGEIKMANPPKCRECNMVLKWPKWTGKPQRPVEPTGQLHDCPMFGGNKSYKGEKWVNLKKEDLEMCEYCGRWLLTEKSHEKYPNVNYTSRIDHLQTLHPNGEILDSLDFIVISDVGREELRKKLNIPKPTKLYSTTSIKI